MGKLVKFKTKLKKDNKYSDEFLEVLEVTRKLYLQGAIENVLVIVNGKDIKACGGTGMLVEESKDMCRDFIEHYEDYGA